MGREVKIEKGREGNDAEPLRPCVRASSKQLVYGPIVVAVLLLASVKEARLLSHPIPSHPIPTPSIHPSHAFSFTRRYSYQMINTITQASRPSIIQARTAIPIPIKTHIHHHYSSSSSLPPPLSDAAPPAVVPLLLPVLALALTLPLPLPLAPPALALKVNFSLVEACWALLAEGKGVPTLEALAVDV